MSSRSKPLPTNTGNWFTVGTVAPPGVERMQSNCSGEKLLTAKDFVLPDASISS